MARKPKRMALYEAIRQGQMKIADGLKNGQMRSDGLGQATQKVKPVEYKSPPVGKAHSISEEMPLRRAPRPSRMMMVVLGIAAQVLILGLGIWLGVLFMGSDDQPPVQKSQEPARNSDSGGRVADSTEKEVEPEEAKSETGFFWNRKKAADEADEPAPKDEIAKKEEPAKQTPLPPRQVLSSGGNVIAIQSITPSRKNELNPLVEYFSKKGIETTIIIDSGSGYAVLVTKAGFKRNPGVKGTDGYVLYNRIKQLGISFVEETENTDFGVRPFQDIYGYKIK